MAKNVHSEPDVRSDVMEHIDEASPSLAERGRAIADQIPDLVKTAAGVNDGASAQVEDLSDQGVVAALALASGVMIGLFFAGAPRPILALGLFPVGITARAAMQRGVRVSRLLH